jgi:DNA-directed RNA polymerase subunit omega
MRDDYLLGARKVIDDPYILVNVVSRRVKQLRRGARPLVESLEKLLPEDIALREIIEGKISYEIKTLTKEESEMPDRLSNRHGLSRHPLPSISPHA